MFDRVCNPTPQEPRRFSLRLPRPLWITIATIALLVLAVGLHFGIPIYQQHVAIHEITAIGGWVQFAEVTPQTRWLHQLVGRVPNDAIPGFTHERAVEFLKRIVEIEEVAFSPDRDTWYKRFSGNLCGPIPWVVGPTINNTELACLRRLPHLKRLFLSDTNVSDAGMRHVSQLDRLEELAIDGTDVSDASIPLLMGLSELRELYLRDSQMTDAGLARLQDALPRLTIRK